MHPSIMIFFPFVKMMIQFSHPSIMIFFPFLKMMIQFRCNSQSHFQSIFIFHLKSKNLNNFSISVKR